MIHCDLRLCFRQAEVHAVLPEMLEEPSCSLYLCPEHFRSLMTAVTQADVQAFPVEALSERSS